MLRKPSEAETLCQDVARATCCTENKGKMAFPKGLEESFRNQLSKSNEDAEKYQWELHRFEDQMVALMADRMSWQKTV
jgi:hypothetical protein